MFSWSEFRRDELPAPFDDNRHLVAGVRSRQTRDLPGIFDGRAVDLDDAVARLPTSFGGWRSSGNDIEIGALVVDTVDTDDEDHQHDREDDIHAGACGKEKRPLVRLL